MLDVYKFGTVERISPEAPVPVILINNTEYRLGGAGNVANNLKSLGENVILFTQMNSSDVSGHTLMKLLRNRNIEFHYIDDKRPTITKERFIAVNYFQQVLRADYESSNDLDIKYTEELIEKINKIKNKFDIIVISDYGKGLISNELLEGLPKNKKILVDPKPKNMRLYTNVFLIKPNLYEASKFLGYKIMNNDSDVSKAGKKIVSLLNANVIITRGAKGATLVTLDNEIVNYKQKSDKVHDVTGAGDTFISILASAMDNGYSLKKAVLFANRGAGISVNKFGTSTVTWDEIKNGC